MDAVQFRKLNKVGSNSRPNGYVTLLGKTTEPVVRTLMKLKTIEPDLDYTKFCSNYLDDKTYIPVNYRSAGYKFQPASNFTEVDFKAIDENLRGSSLLRRFQAGKRRNCKTLPIPFEYCICQYEKRDVTDEALKQSLGQFAAEELASLLYTQNVTSECEEIKLQKVEAKQYLSRKINNLCSNTNFFEVTFEVAAPAKGKFQIPIRKEQGHLDLGGALFKRMDRYGENGDCMRNHLLQPYCTCNNDSTFR
ncbi:hypothetical protein Y032_0231g3010 [Ancylostoma ceylanicum]|uniref:Uncharacterized protein n=1 Tax=Ancylostoma ceylanicum TaxID=53326 RepID=A0A016SFX7_9BILA|nr:hypothetical protein Y032_0231g3010 [Ancylostoma ceylanicum]